jgi:vacuolar-type H+-ATPase subunit H
MKPYANANVTDWLGDAARRNPEAVLLMAAGCALLMRTGRGAIVRAADQTGTIRSSEPFGLSESVRQASGKVSQSVRDAREKVSDYAGDIGERLSDTANSYVNTAADYSTQAQRRLSSGSERISKQAQSAVQTTSQNLREQPLLVAALGLLTGAAVASLFPPTEFERRTFGDARRTVEETASKARENLTHAAGETMQQLKDDAANRGMAPDSFKQMARDAAATFSKAAAGGREQAQEASQAPTARDVRNDRN